MPKLGQAPPVRISVKFQVFLSLITASIIIIVAGVFFKLGSHPIKLVKSE